MAARSESADLIDVEMTLIYVVVLNALVFHWDECVN